KDVIDTTQWNSQARYVAVMDIPSHFFVAPGSILLCNLGSGSIARNYIHEGWTVHVADPDSSLISIVKKNFPGFIIDSALSCDDGRNYLISHSAKFDIILIDGIAPAQLPTELVTKEFFVLTAEHISHDGMVGIAVESVGWNDAIVQSLCATLKEVYKNVFVLPIAEPPDQFGSIVILATNSDKNIVRDPNRNTSLDPDWRYGSEYQKTHAWDNHFTPDTRNGILLTDSFNRYDTMFSKLIDSERVHGKNYIP
ncbi:MAG TPA: fused MFS/spermidine synthase, partial [Bacteroidota bacterium]|nr:fused MFS/spermidine synthase [Bacteroidota bacterium]